jgi:hypothetical protein
MATRKILSHDTQTREKIRTSQLINRLEKHAFGEVELTQTQVRAIEILIKKTLPDLASVELTGDKDNPVALQLIKRTIVDPKS